ncbi:hypothetical protein [Amycolatopsis tolypomycina]|uniref:hypothetical protein n=1 Tax=Amycolatopsis tolypomycina TaxID=208445 RepID=UPI0033AF6FA1
MELTMAPLMTLAKQGIGSFLDQLRGTPTLGSVRTEIISALQDLSYELRRSVEQGVGNLIEHPYRMALARGIRTLADAASVGAAARPRELIDAREHFKNAQAAAVSPVQVAIAEEYLMICALALDEPELAETAYRLFRRSAFHGALKAAGDYMLSDSVAREHVGPLRVPADSRKAADKKARVEYENRVRNEQSRIDQGAVRDFNESIVALRDAYLVAGHFGDESPILARVDDGDTPRRDERAIGGYEEPEHVPRPRLDRWAFSASDAGPDLVFEELTIKWREVESLPDPDRRRSRFGTFKAGDEWQWFLQRIGLYGARPTEYHRAEVAVGTRSQIPTPVILELASEMRMVQRRTFDTALSQSSSATSTLPANENGMTTLHAEFVPSGRTTDVTTVNLVVNGAFVLEAPRTTG